MTVRPEFPQQSPSRHDHLLQLLQLSPLPQFFPTRCRLYVNHFSSPFQHMCYKLSSTLTTSTYPFILSFMYNILTLPLNMVNSQAVLMKVKQRWSPVWTTTCFALTYFACLPVHIIKTEKTPLNGDKGFLQICSTVNYIPCSPITYLVHLCNEPLYRWICTFYDMYSMYCTTTFSHSISTGQLRSHFREQVPYLFITII